MNVFFLLNYLIKLTRSHSYKSAACLYDAIFYVFLQYFLNAHILYLKYDIIFFVFFVFMEYAYILYIKYDIIFFCIFCIFNVQYAYAVF